VFGLRFQYFCHYYCASVLARFAVLFKQNRHEISINFKSNPNPNSLFIGGGGSGRPLRAGFGGRRRVGRVLKPSHLSGRSVALLIAGGDPEDYGGFGGRVDVGGRQMGVTHRTGRLATAVHPHERQLVGVRGYRLLAGARLRRLHRQIHGILGYLSGRQMRRLPRQVRPFGAL
jgi:hypothetical protein